LSRVSIYAELGGCRYAEQAANFDVLWLLLLAVASDAAAGLKWVERSGKAGDFGSRNTLHLLTLMPRIMVWGHIAVASPELLICRVRGMRILYDK
jgi:hypothetical protein